MMWQRNGNAYNRHRTPDFATLDAGASCRRSAWSLTGTVLTQAAIVRLRCIGCPGNDPKAMTDQGHAFACACGARRAPLPLSPTRPPHLSDWQHRLYHELVEGIRFLKQRRMG